MASSAPSARATYADIEALPPNVVGEILNGVLEVSPRPAARHSLAATEMSTDLGGPFSRGRGGPGGWWFLFEPELHLDGHVLVPDIAAWRRTRMPSIPETAAITLVPDWVCEVLSPSTARTDRLKKMRIYASLGVKHAWLVDPIDRYVEAFRLTDGNWTRVGAFGDESDFMRAEPFDAVEFDLLPWWGETRDETPPK